MTTMTPVTPITPVMPRVTTSAPAGTPLHDEVHIDAAQSSTTASTLPYVLTGALESDLVCCSSVSGGIGLSTLSAMIAREVASRSVTCALVDADFRAGGLDVLLGLENEPGLRFGDVEAPLGRIEGEALERGLPHWDGVSVLAHHPWDSDEPQIWEVQAALSALNHVHDIVLVDCADGSVWHMLPELKQAVHLVAVELSVLGLARAGAHLNTLNAGAETKGHASRKVMVVGFLPYRTGHRNTVVVSSQEAEDYLGLPVIATVRYDQGIAHDLLEGFGIRSIPKSSRAAVDAVVERLRPAGGRHSRGNV